MNLNLTNAGISAIATGLIALGANTISGDLLKGAIEIALGLLAFVIYEMTPPGPTI